MHQYSKVSCPRGFREAPGSRLFLKFLKRYILKYRLGLELVRWQKLIHRATSHRTESFGYHGNPLGPSISRRWSVSCSGVYR